MVTLRSVVMIPPLLDELELLDELLDELELLEELELLDELVPEPVQTGGEKLPSCVP